MKCSTCGLASLNHPCACDPAWEIAGGDKRLIRTYIGRLHVGTPMVQVARDMLTRAKKYPKRVRFETARYAMKVHQYNRDEYRWVVAGETGRLSRRIPHPKPITY